MTWLAVGMAFWLGILTAISPCPMATNIAAISFIGRQVGDRRKMIQSGVLYAFGRTVAYVALGVAVTAGVLASAGVSRFLQKYMNEFLGPVLILLGMVLLGWIGSGLSFNLAGTGVQRRASRGGGAWAALLGLLFALSFCPVSAGLFFGALIPLSIREGSPLLLPMVYGIGTALPVLAFAVAIAVSTEYVGRLFDRLTQVERWMRAAAGVLFILGGLYYCVTHVYAG